jgi:hypothetical protein
MKPLLNTIHCKSQLKKLNSSLSGLPHSQQKGMFFFQNTELRALNDSRPESWNLHGLCALMQTDFYWPAQHYRIIPRHSSAHPIGIGRTEDRATEIAHAPASLSAFTAFLTSKTDPSEAFSRLAFIWPLSALTCFEPGSLGQIEDAALRLDDGSSCPLTLHAQAHAQVWSLKIAFFAAAQQFHHLEHTKYFMLLVSCHFDATMTATLLKPKRNDNCFSRPYNVQTVQLLGVMGIIT